MIKNYEILVAQDGKTVFLPIINPEVQLDHENVQASVVDGVLQLTDGVKALHFADFPDRHAKLIEKHGKICILDVSSPEDLKDFEIPVKVTKVNKGMGGA